MAQKIEARFIMQIAGKPAANVEKALKIVDKKLKDEKKAFKLIESEVVEPELDEESTLYSGMVECLVKFDDAEKLMGFILDYTPNSVEIESPDNLKFDSVAFTAILTDMSTHMLQMNNKLRHAHAMLHHLDAQLKGKKK